MTALAPAAFEITRALRQPTVDIVSIMKANDGKAKGFGV